MGGSRGALVAMLIAVEALIAGFGIWTLRGGSMPGFAMQQAIAAPRNIASLALGDSPHIVVSDPDSHVDVKVSDDGQVHVRDLTTSGAYSSGRIEPVRVTRTADGALVERAASHDSGFTWSFFSTNNERETEIDVPAGARLEIQKSSGASIAGLKSDLYARSQDGRITVDGHDGNVDANSQDGRIVLTNVRADSLKLGTSDGRIEMHDVTTQTLEGDTADGPLIATNLKVEGANPRASLTTRDGSVRIDGSFAGGGKYEFTTGDGRVDLSLASGSDLSVAASTDDGALVIDGTKYGGDGSVQHNIRLGSGTGSLRVSSGDGSVRITTNGAF